MAPAQQQRAETPPYVTSDMHQSLEQYQQAFWKRQMARVEEQVSLPQEHVAALAAVGGAGGSTARDDAEAPALSDADIAASAKSLMELFKPQAGQLPLARIKKVMKASDDEVKMISAEAPILFARACEIFIADLTCRSYMNATTNKRRTVQRSDVVAAVAGSNLFDFLVDIVPRGADGDAEAGASATGGANDGLAGDGIAEGDEGEANDSLYGVSGEQEAGVEYLQEGEE